MDKKIYTQVKKLIKDKKYASAEKILEGKEVDLDLEGKKVLLKVYMINDKDKVEPLAYDLYNDGEKDALNQLGKFYIKEKKFEEAEKLYDDLVNKKIINEKFNLNNKLNLYKASGQINKAIETCDEIMKKYPKEGDMTNVKNILLEIKNKKMIKINNYMENQKYPKVVKELEGKYLTGDENKILLEAYINTNAKSDKILDVISKIPVTKISSKDLIIQGYEQVNSKDPKNVEVITKLGTLYKENGNKDKMKNLFAQIRENGLVNDDGILKFKIDLYSKENKYELATKWANRYMEKHPEDSKMKNELSKLEELQKEKIQKIKLEKEQEKKAQEEEKKKEELKKQKEEQKQKNQEEIKNNKTKEQPKNNNTRNKRKVKSPKYNKEKNKNRRYEFNRKEKVPHRERNNNINKDKENKKANNKEVAIDKVENVTSSKVDTLDEKTNKIKNLSKDEKKKLKFKLNNIKNNEVPKKYKMSDKEVEKESKKAKLAKAIKNNQYYSAGMLAISLGDFDKAVVLLEQSIELEGKSAKTFNGLGKAYYRKHDNNKSRVSYAQAVKCDQKNKFKSITKLADVYMADKMYPEAEYLYKKAIERNEKGKFYSVYEHSQLGTIYTDQENYKDAEYHLKKGIEESDKNLKDNLMCKMKMSVMIAKQGHDDVAKKMYEDIMEQMPKRFYDAFKSTHLEERTRKHILKHKVDNKEKCKHGVFKINPIDVYENVDLSKIHKNPAYLGDVYCMQYENCGYEGGKDGTNRQLDYITIVTEPFSKKIITMYPSDKVEVKCKVVENKSNIEMLKRLVKEKQQLHLKEKSLDNKINEKEEVSYGREQ